MELHLYKALWGMNGTYADMFDRIAAAGYTGIEAGPPQEGQEEEFMSLLERHGLSYIAQVYSGGEDHIGSFQQQARRVAAFEPVLIVSHSARDCMTEAEQDRFFGAALETEAEIGIPVGHETHRHRSMFTPWTTGRLLRKFPELRIAADFSHWLNVCESHLDDQREHLELAIERTVHIHGRIGFPQGPQVPHPASPGHRRELELFTGWWKEILSRQARAGKAYATFTAEFGPPDYMPTIPLTDMPIADLWEVNQWMSDYMAAKFADWNL